jgi:type IV pilus assembly protein PilQ
MKDKAKVALLIFLSSLCMLFAQAEEPTVTVQLQDKKDAKVAVDLDIKDADIKDVARALSRISGKNIIVSEEVKAKVTLRVKDVDWREALNMIVSAYNFAVLEEENYIVITTLEKRRAAQEGGELQTRIIRFNFMDVNEIQKTLSSMLTQRGKIEIDVRTNSLVITDIPERIDKIQEVALQLDTKTPQVLIEAMMLTVKLTGDEQLGVDWTMTHKKMSQIKVNQGLKLGSTEGSITYGKTLLPWADFSATIDFWLQNKRAQILANPRVLTLDNLTAAIELTEQEPYSQQTTTDQGGTVKSTQFKDVPIKLYVKPHITKDKYIFMNIKTEQSYRTGYTTDNQPIIDSRKAETNVMVKDGETVVIGGLRKKEDSTTIDKFPILGDIPLLGNLFRKTIKSKVDTELIIFVTPYIATDTKLSEAEEKHLEKIKEMEGKEKGKKKKISLLTEPYPLRPPLGRANK